MSPDPNADAAALEAEFEAFSQLCDRLAGFGSEAQPEWADGYLTALICGPVMVSPVAFAQAVFGDALNRAFADPPDFQQALDTISARWNRIAEQLLPERLYEDEDALYLTPLMQVWDDEARAEVAKLPDVTPESLTHLNTGALWSTGFVQAVDDYADDWVEPPAARKADAAGYLGELIASIIVLAEPEGSEVLADFKRKGWKDGTATRDELIAEASYAVQELRLYWLQFPPKREPIRNELKLGRNDLCFCGSGKKYKRCHGAAPND